MAACTWVIKETFQLLRLRKRRSDGCDLVLSTAINQTNSFFPLVWKRTKRVDVAAAETGVSLHQAKHNNQMQCQNEPLHQQLA